MKRDIPVGVADFFEIRENNYYYVDKTGLIEDLLETPATKVTLITRPRRFGKTLVMSMLENFFNIQKDNQTLFEGLEIAKNKALCDAWMNQWPTIFISFKDIDGITFQMAYERLVLLISELYRKHMYLLESDIINASEKKIFSEIMEGTANTAQMSAALRTLMKMMQSYYHKPVILLIDEYDVPVAKANTNGYYNEMLDMMKGIMQALKDNTSLRFAVITGCLKIAKESIFTGTNNFVSDTITDSRLNEYFGFTQKEVDLILEDFNAKKHAEQMKIWYDGYHFGKFDIYCPWDVMNYMRDIQYNPEAKPGSYWKNTSDNAIIRSFIDYAGSSITKKLETLLSGNYILQRIDEDLTYDYLHSSEDNLWSILYLTGYLTKVRDESVSKKNALSMPGHVMPLIIPNAEIKDIFETTIMQWFDDNAKTWNRNALFGAVWHADTDAMTQEMTKLLRKTISYHDYKEDFYHAFLAGIFAGAGYMVESNREHGEGRSDVVVYDPTEAQVAIFEVKYARTLDEMVESCEAALHQIDEKLYAKEYEDDYDRILCFGISFFKKRCLVKKKNM